MRIPFKLPALGRRKAGAEPKAKRVGEQGRQIRNRTIIAIGCFVAVYAVIGGRLVQYGLADIDTQTYYAAVPATSDEFLRLPGQRSTI